MAEAAARELLSRGVCSVFDAGCGGGILLSLLQDAGVNCQGSDISPAMVGLAKAKGVQATVGTWQDARPEPGAVVCATGEVLAYEVAHHEAALRTWFGLLRERRCRLLFDVPTTGRATAGPSTFSGDGWTVVASSQESGSTLLRTITTTRGDSTTTETHRLLCKPANWWQDLLRECGYSTESLGAYDDLMLQAGWDAFWATPEP